jgi:hypothetical protein
VGTKVLAYNAHDWACKCWSARRMIGHESVGPLKGMFVLSSIGKGMFVLSSIGTLTCVKLLVTCVESVLPPYPN